MKLKIRKLEFHQKILLFIFLLLVLNCVLFIITGYLNFHLDKLFSNYKIVINHLTIPKSSVIIAPIIEEIIKFVGYGILLLFNLKILSKLEYASKRKFLNKYLIIAFLISAGGFGLFEGVIHNVGFNRLCFIAFISLNTLIHITYSIYPFILGRKYRNWFICFLPIAMLLHAFHNFLIGIVWDNKWVTVIMVTIFLLPILVLKHKHWHTIIEKIYSIKFKNHKRANRFLYLIFFIIYVYIFFCCLLAF